MNSTVKKLQNALLIGVDLPEKSQIGQFSIRESMYELADLSKTAEITVVGQIIQKRDTIDSVSYIGKGKAEELLALISTKEVTLVITDDELTPNQQKNLEKILNVKVLDRTGLILEIFVKRAKTHEAQLQVELAQLEYTLPRLTRMWRHLSRQAGGIGTKGPGETQLEVDKRQIGIRISLIKKKIEKIKAQREINRQKRENVPMVTAALIGYTNAGKSTLLNQLTNANILAENKLFATLDPTTRKLKLPNNNTILLTDTVGFVQKLPHQLISAFRATLEEASSAQIQLHVIDASSPNWKQMIETANNLLHKLDADQASRLYVFNKIDAVKNIQEFIQETRYYSPAIYVSAIKKETLNELTIQLSNLLKKYQKTYAFHIPFSKMFIQDLIHTNGSIISEKFTDQGVNITAILNTITGDKLTNMLYSQY